MKIYISVNGCEGVKGTEQKHFHEMFLGIGWSLNGLKTLAIKLVQYLYCRNGAAFNRPRHMEKCLCQRLGNIQCVCRSSSWGSTYPQAQSSQPTNYWPEIPTVQPNLCFSVRPAQPSTESCLTSTSATLLAAAQTSSSNWTDYCKQASTGNPRSNTMHCNCCRFPDQCFSPPKFHLSANILITLFIDSDHLMKHLSLMINLIVVVPKRCYWRPVCIAVSKIYRQIIIRHRGNQSLSCIC